MDGYTGRTCSECRQPIFKGCLFGHRRRFFCALCAIEVAHKAHAMSVIRSEGWQERIGRKAERTDWRSVAAAVMKAMDGEGTPPRGEG